MTNQELIKNYYTRYKVISERQVDLCYRLMEDLKSLPYDALENELFLCNDRGRHRFINRENIPDSGDIIQKYIFKMPNIEELLKKVSVNYGLLYEYYHQLHPKVKKQDIKLPDKFKAKSYMLLDKKLEKLEGNGNIFGIKNEKMHIATMRTSEGQTPNDRHVYSLAVRYKLKSNSEGAIQKSIDYMKTQLNNLNNENRYLTEKYNNCIGVIHLYGKKLNDPYKAEQYFKMNNGPLSLTNLSILHIRIQGLEHHDKVLKALSIIA